MNYLFCFTNNVKLYLRGLYVHGFASILLRSKTDLKVVKITELEITYSCRVLIYPMLVTCVLLIFSCGLL